jgi:aspartyl-tRNA(Asn)/glutamyl-tRNA(Gln) amidotransferase subunit B
VSLPPAPPGFEPVIGLEAHVQLKTRSKLFCGCANRFGAPPNHLTCPVCLGLPGALPVLNRSALELGIRAALALGAEVAEVTRFDRKNYFYPDQPKNYQITQYERPLARRGALLIASAGAGRKRVRIRRIQLEEDAGKLVHDARGFTAVDLNRSGVPLLEIVSEPDLASPEEAHAFLADLRLLLRHLDVSDGNMEEGSLRCDVNISVRRPDDPLPADKVEVKNLNSFRAVRQALHHEFRRQATLLSEPGGRVRRETRLFEARTGRTRPLRSKEEEQDYRYFPEPDLPPIRIDPALVARARAALPELPRARIERIIELHGLSPRDARALVEDRALADYFEATATIAGDGRAAAAWVRTEVKRVLKEGRATIASFPVPPARLAGLIALRREAVLSAGQAREVFEAMIESGASAEAVVKARGIEQISDPVRLEAAVRDAIAANPRAVADCRRGKRKARDAIIGHVMRSTRGQANPQRVGILVDRVLAEPER